MERSISLTASVTKSVSSTLKKRDEFVLCIDAKTRIEKYLQEAFAEEMAADKVTIIA